MCPKNMPRSNQLAGVFNQFVGVGLSCGKVFRFSVNCELWLFECLCIFDNFAII